MAGHLTKTAGMNTPGRLLRKCDLSLRNQYQLKLMQEFGIDRNNQEAVKHFAEQFSRVYDGFDIAWLRRELKHYYR